MGFRLPLAWENSILMADGMSYSGNAEAVVVLANWLSVEMDKLVSGCFL